MGSSAAPLTARHHPQQQAHSKYMDALNRSSNPGSSAVCQMLAAYQQQQQAAVTQEAKQMEYAAAAAAVAAAAGEPPPPPPEPKALNWAERNLWFGTDTEMTEFAYQVRGRLLPFPRSSWDDAAGVCLIGGLIELAGETDRCRLPMNV